jgi:hypothetical protein
MYHPNFKCQLLYVPWCALLYFVTVSVQNEKISLFKESVLPLIGQNIGIYLTLETG